MQIYKQRQEYFSKYILDIFCFYNHLVIFHFFVSVECIFKHDNSVDVAKTFLRHTNENVSRRAPRLSFRGHSVIEGRDFLLKMSTCTFKVRRDRENSNCITKPRMVDKSRVIAFDGRRFNDNNFCH